MTGAVPEPAADGQPTVEQAALAAEAAAGAETPPPAPALSAALADPHPERAVGAAFAGGLVLALLFKRLAR